MAREKSIESSRPNLYYLPEEILIEILVRVPVKSLLRFRSICKSWYSLITNPSLIEAHLNHQRNNTNLLLVKSECAAKVSYSIQYDDNEYFEPKAPLHLKYFRIYGCCDGLICLSDVHLTPSSNTFLWNPALRKFKTLPMPPQTNELPTRDSADYYYMSIAFGFHSRVNDYNVVRAIFYRRRRDNPYFKTSFVVDVYSLSTDSWRRIDALAPSSSSSSSCRYTIADEPPAFMNGVVYWTAIAETTAPGNRIYTYTLLRFELGIEALEEVTLPPPEPEEKFHCPYIFALGELLYVLKFVYVGEKRCYESYDLWTMESSKMGMSWTKQRFTVDFQAGQFLGFTRNGELVKMDLNYYKLLCNNNGNGAHFFVESLLLVDGRGESFSTC